VGGQAYSYDANGNLQSGGGRTYAWTADNQPSSITGSDNVQEDYAYDADGMRVSRTRGTVTTLYLGGLVEQEGTTTRTLYTFGGQVIAQREGSGVVYLHGDHLGSISVATSATGAVVSTQEYTPWGEVRSGGISETTLNYTGQRKDGTGLLFYGARYYDPGLARFVSADSIVPGVADGKGGSAATLGYDERVKLTPLTVDFHEPKFAATASGENAITQEQGFWFQLDNEGRQAAKYPWGPLNPQALNRYSYVLNNPLRYTDPTGHNPVAAALLAAGIALEAPVVAALVAGVGAYLLLQCVASPACRHAVAALVQAGVSNVKRFVAKVSHLIEDQGPTLSGTLRSKSGKYWHKLGIDPHDVKDAFWGGNMSDYDLFLDDENRVWTKRKGADDETAQYVGTIEETAENYPYEEPEERGRRRDGGEQN
jgi:RHS repeat-associated protein